jgi:hypothetical protein
MRSINLFRRLKYFVTAIIVLFIVHLIIVFTLNSSTKNGQNLHLINNPPFNRKAIPLPTTTTTTTVKSNRYNDSRDHKLQNFLTILNENYKINMDYYIKTKLKNLNDTFFVIVIQVHDRIAYLNELIESLRMVKHIEETLVIFSLDVYNIELNNLITDIDFCSVKHL